MVVLRGFDPDRFACRFYTDRRAAKVREIRSIGDVELVFFDPVAMIQIRFDAAAVVDPPCVDGRAIARTMSLGQLRDYAAVQAPGEGLSPGGAPSNVDTEMAVANFCVIDVLVRGIDFLAVARSGNRRAAFARGSPLDQPATWHGGWVTP